MALTSGTRLGPYEILAPLGAGGMGEVYKARDTRLARTVAIKVLPADAASDAAARARFDREARAIAALSHPHICVVYDVGHQEGIDYLVMELLDGETLAERLARAKGPLPLGEVLTIGAAIADALDKAHRAGIVHRDLKPANVMLTKSGPKLLDFGLAKLHGAASPVSLSDETAATTAGPGTAKGTILGTIHYMSPEQVEGREADPRSDIWALGALLYEMATGQRPFDGESAASIVGAILKDAPPLVSARLPVSPPFFDHLVQRCLDKDPDGRYQSAADLGADLVWVRDGGNSASVVVPPHRRQTQVAWALAVLGLLGSGGMAAALFTRPAEVRPDAPAVVFEIPTHPSDERGSFDLSPDGRQLAYVATREEDRPRIWIRSMDQTDARPLSGTEGATYPFWSPDGRSLGFFADRKLKRIDVPGGNALALANAPNGRGGTWSRDGVILFAGNTVDGLSQVSANGGPTKPVARTGPGAPANGPRWPSFLPDGQHFLCFVQLAGPDVRGVYLGSLASERLTRLLVADSAAAFAAPGYLLGVGQDNLQAWSFDPATGAVGAQAAQIASAAGADNTTGRGPFAVSTSGTLVYRRGMGERRRLVVADRAGRILEGIGPDADAAGLANPELSPDGRRLNVTRIVQGNNDVWFVDVARGVESRFTSDDAAEQSGIWSPDQSRVVFATIRKGVYDLFEKPVSGSADETPLLVTEQTKSPLSWSQDGRLLLYRTNNARTGRSDLFVLPLGGDRKPFPLVQANFDVTDAQFSPDGRWIAYTSNESGRFEVSVRRFPGPGETTQVSSGGGSQVRWRPDGKELYYVAGNSTLMAAPISGGSDDQPLNIGAAVPLFPTRLASGSNVTGNPQYAVTREGRFILNIDANETTAPPFTVVLNWLSLLKK